MMKIQDRKVIFSDIVIILIFIVIVFSMFLRSARSNSLYNSCKNPHELKAIIQTETKNTFLDKEYKSSRLEMLWNNILDSLSGNTFTNSLLLYFNPHYPLSVNCSTCFETEECEEDQEEPFFYPKQITLLTMFTILESSSPESYRVFMVQLSNHPSEKLSFPYEKVFLHEFTDKLNELPKQNPVFIIGSTYLETKIASESLVRAGFKKTYRVITLMKREMDSNE